LENLAVELCQVTKSFGSVHAVENVDLQIRKGEFFSLVGPSGCGKTTTLRLIAGFEEPTSGEVRIDGQNVSGLPAYRRNVNTVFQSYALFPHLNIFENVAFGLRRRRVAEKEIAARVVEALAMVHLKDFQSRSVRELSGGQQQRVALARALVNQPKVLLLDEPMAALDSKLRKEMRSELKRLQKSLGLTFVLVTHDQEEALTMSDRVAVVNGGKLEQVSNPREMYDHPATRFVAEFIGTANFLPVKVTQIQNGRTQYAVAGGQFWAPSRTGFREGDAAELSLRPERLDLAKEPAEHRNCVPGKVVDSVFMGPITRFVVELPEGHSVLAERQNDEPGFEQGESVFVQWDTTCGSLLEPSKD